AEDSHPLLGPDGLSVDLGLGLGYRTAPAPAGDRLFLFLVRIVRVGPGVVSQDVVDAVQSLVVDQEFVLVDGVLAPPPLARRHFALFHIAGWFVTRRRSSAARPLANLRGRLPDPQGRQDSNLQPAVLETAALPIAPHP